MESQSHNFSSMEEFIAWKTSEEKYSGSKFNRSSGNKIRGVGERKKQQQFTVYKFYKAIIPFPAGEQARQVKAWCMGTMLVRDRERKELEPVTVAGKKNPTHKEVSR